MLKLRQHRLCSRRFAPLQTVQHARIVRSLQRCMSESNTLVAARAQPDHGMEVADQMTTLSRRIQEREAELLDMFESGRPLPKAAMVHGVRDEIMTLKEELQNLLNNVAQAEWGSVDIDPEAVLQALMVLQGVNGSKEAASEYSKLTRPEYELQLAILLAENEKLRQEAEALLKRQMQLEDLAEKFGIRPKTRF